MTTTSDPPTAARPRRRGGLLRELAIVVVGALVVSALLRTFVGQLFVIPSESMENTLLKGDRVVVSKLSDFRRGQVVVFTDPGGWLPDSEAPGLVGRLLGQGPSGHLIKRVIGMPGDTVVCCDDRGRVSVNGAALDEAGYLYTAPTGRQSAPSEVRFRVVVPADHLLVMGDHRDLSADSRCHLSDVSVQGTGQTAFVPVSLVAGPAYAVVSPFSRVARLRIPDTFAAVPAPTAPAPAVGVIEPAGVRC